MEVREHREGTDMYYPEKTGRDISPMLCNERYSALSHFCRNKCNRDSKSFFPLVLAPTKRTYRILRISS